MNPPHNQGPGMRTQQKSGFDEVEIPSGVAAEDWRDWTWQMRNRIRSSEELARYVHPIDDEKRANEQDEDQIQGQIRTNLFRNRRRGAIDPRTNIQDPFE